MPEEGLSKFQAAIAKRKAEQALKEAKANLAKEFEDLAPDEQYTLTAEQKQLDQVLNGIDIITAYVKWCNKSPVRKHAGQKESIMISCPNPAHPDKHPSAWINSDKQVWNCASCELGGDKYDIAAWHFGYSVPSYKDGRNFHDLRESMARDLGYVIENVPGSEPLIYLPEVVEIEPEDKPTRSEIETVREAFEQEDSEDQSGDNGDDSQSVPEGSTEQEVIEHLEKEFEEEIATVTAIFGEPVLKMQGPLIDWRNIVEPDTFLRSYMEATTVDDAAEEYHFWNGLLALGVAVGPEVVLFDSTPVYSNLLLCILGGTGDRKSRSFGHTKKLLKLALPHKYADPNDKGVYLPGALASGEALINAFSKPIPDPTNPKLIASYGSVRGLVEFNELSSLVSRTSRIGATLKDVIMEFADTSNFIASTSITHGAKIAENSFCSMFTTTQPESMKDLVKKSDTTSGFLNRWIFATGIPKQKFAIGGNVIDLVKPANELQKIHRWPGLKGITVTWHKDAEKLFTDHFHKRIHPIQEHNPILARLDLLEKKLILLFCINEMLSEVPEYVVEKVIALHDYLVSIFLSSAKMAGNHENNEIEEEIMRQIKQLCAKSPQNMVTLARVKQNIQHKGWDIEKVNRIWKIVKESGDIEEIRVNAGKRGRPSVAYKYIGEEQ